MPFAILPLIVELVIDPRLRNNPPELAAAVLPLNVELVMVAPTDALVALRTGDCDALVHDSVMLEELLRYPEWKKFSRRLHSSERSTLAVLVPAEDKAAIAAVRQITADWRAKAYPVSLVKNAVRNIAFEVYLEQDVPDCH